MKNFNNYLKQKFKRSQNENIIERLKIDPYSKLAKIPESNWEFGCEGTEITDNVDSIGINMEDNHKKKYGFFCYEKDTDIAYVMNFDSIEDLRKAYCVDYGFEILEDMDVFDSDYDRDFGSYYFRLW